MSVGRNNNNNNTTLHQKQKPLSSGIMNGLFVGIFVQESCMQFLLDLETVTRRIYQEIVEKMHEIQPGLSELKNYLIKNQQFQQQEYYQQKYNQYINIIREGLETIREWPQKVIEEESTKAQRQCKSISMLYKTSYLTYLREIYASSEEQRSNNIVLRIYVPGFSDFLFKFLCKLQKNPDLSSNLVSPLGSGGGGLAEGLIYRKLFFMESIRNIFSEYFSKTVEKDITPVNIDDNDSVCSSDVSENPQRRKINNGDDDDDEEDESDGGDINDDDDQVQLDDKEITAEDSASQLGPKKQNQQKINATTVSAYITPPATTTIRTKLRQQPLITTPPRSALSTKPILSQAPQQPQQQTVITSRPQQQPQTPQQEPQTILKPQIPTTAASSLLPSTTALSSTPIVEHDGSTIETNSGVPSTEQELEEDDGTQHSVVNSTLDADETKTIIIARKKSNHHSYPQDSKNKI